MAINYIQNPILPGFYPDPSICRVGDNFYLITSSFETCPGIPLFHSKDLAHWKQLCYVLTPENGFELDCNSFRGGVMAPTIRYHNGTFYIINMSFAQGGNFIVTAKDPAGPWSRIHMLPDVPGIDASLFFDDDGKCYVISTGDVTNPEGKQEKGIWAQEFDIDNFCVIGERHSIWNCALRGATSPEAPHLYRKDGWYYLIIAEGGTEHYHAVTVARARNIFDWYEGNPANPIMTHRHMGQGAPIANVGHADMVELPDGSWWAVMLGSRTNSGPYKNIGRESFICPVSWEQDWPLFSPETGKIEWQYAAPECLPWTPLTEQEPKDDFDGDALDLQWVFWGRPYQNFYRLKDGTLWLKCLRRNVDRPLKPMGPGSNADAAKDDCVSTVLRRQQSYHFEASTKLTFCPKAAEAAGLLLMQASNNSFRAELMQKDGSTWLRVMEVTSHADLPPYHPMYKPVTNTTEHVMVPWKEESVVIVLRVKDQNHDFYYGPDEAHLQPLCLGLDGRHINTPVSGNMVGTCLGIFATGDGVDSENEAAFDYFRYQDL